MEFLAQLERDGVKLDAAVWVFNEETDSWRLVLALPDVDKIGPLAAYERVLPSLHKSQLKELDSSGVTIDRGQANVARLLRSAVRVQSSSRGVRFSRGAINGTYINDAYIYALN